MKIMERNKREFSYLLYDHSEAVVDSSGYDTGAQRVIYKSPVKIKANISPAGGSSQVEQFGNLSGYDRVVVTDDVACPIDENSVLFVDKPVEFDDSGNPLYDYVVYRVAKSLNSISYAIKKVEVS